MEENLKEELLSNNDNLNEQSNDTKQNMTANTTQTTRPGERELTEEDIRLGGKPPLQTVCLLSSGPLISQVTNSLYGIINTIWISKALGDSGLTAISTYQNFDTIGRCFASFLQVSATTKIASLFGEGLNSEASQVLTDLLRFSVVCSIISPSLFIPLSKICVRWFGADEYITNLGFKYIIPNLCLSIIPAVFLILCGCLQAEGRSWLFSITQITALCLEMFVFCPLFLLVFKTGIAGAAIANGIAELIPSIVVLFMYYRGKFGIKPQFSQMLKKFSPHSFEALKLGLAQLILQLSWAIPGVIVRKLFGLSSGNDTNVFNNVMAAFNTFNRLWGIEEAVPNAINIGFIPAASWAFGAKQYMRIIWLLIHALWISVVWCSLSMILTMGFPVQMAKIFSNTPEYLEWAKKIIRNGNISTCVCEIPGIITSLLQAMKLGNQASLLSFLVQLLPVPIAALILYYTDKHNIGRLIYCYPIQTFFGIAVSIPYIVVALRTIIKSHKQQLIEDDNDLENHPERELNEMSVSSVEQIKKENSTSYENISKDQNEKEIKENGKEESNDVAETASIEPFHDPQIDENAKNDI